MTLTLNCECEPGLSSFLSGLALRVIEVVCEALDFPYELEVNLLLVSEEEMQRINLEQRGIDKPTDVLSFPMLTYDNPGEFDLLEIENEMTNFHPETGEALLGDIVLCAPKVKEQAAIYGHSEEREYAFLILHSMLHLFGYDHKEKEEAKLMEALQDKILRELKIER